MERERGSWRGNKFFFVFSDSQERLSYQRVSQVSAQLASGSEDSA